VANEELERVALERTAERIGVDLTGASDRQLKLLRKSGLYQATLMDLALREFGKAVWDALRHR
jgi:hypothetical protein